MSARSCTFRSVGANDGRPFQHRDAPAARPRVAQRRLVETQGKLPDQHVLSRRPRVERPDRPQCRHPLARPRFAQPAQAGPQDRLRQVLDQPEIPRPQVARARQPDPGSVRNTRDGVDAVLRAARHSNAARNARQVVRQGRIHRGLRARRVRRQGVPGAHLRIDRRRHPERRLAVRVRVAGRLALHRPRHRPRRDQAAFRRDHA